MLRKLFKKKRKSVFENNINQTMSKEIERIIDLIGKHQILTRKMNHQFSIHIPSLKFCTETDEFRYESNQFYAHGSTHYDLSIYVKDDFGELKIFYTNESIAHEHISFYCAGEEWKPIVDKAIKKLEEEIEIFNQIENENLALKREREKDKREMLVNHFENKYEKELGVEEFEC